MEPSEIDQITDQIIGAAIKIHQKFGPGLLESVYVQCLGQDLVAAGLEVHISKALTLNHEGLKIDRAYVLDLLVESQVIVEVKSVKKLTEIDTAQLLTYLKLADLRVGLLINFNVTKLVHGLRRVVNRHVDREGRPIPPPRHKQRPIADTATPTKTTSAPSAPSAVNVLGQPDSEE